MDKKRRREPVWHRRMAAHSPRFPGAFGRIPNFPGARQVQDWLSVLDIRTRARAIGCNLDSPLPPVGKRALEEAPIVRKLAKSGAAE